MDLTTHQRQLLSLIKSPNKVPDSDDPYIRTVAQSRHLEIMHEIIVFWKMVGLERLCILTSNILKRRNLFDQAVRTFVSTHDISPFIDRAGVQFLEEMSVHSDSLIASIAQFELAYIKIKRGDQGFHIIDWGYEPQAVLNSILLNLPLDETAICGSYQTIVSQSIPNSYQVIKT